MNTVLLCAAAVVYFAGVRFFFKDMETEFTFPPCEHVALARLIAFVLALVWPILLVVQLACEVGRYIRRDIK